MSLPDPEERTAGAARRIALLRRLVLRTSVPPLTQLYLLAYRFVLWRAARVLRRYPAVKAAYIRHSYARGKALPGLSDIDILLLTDSDDPSFADYSRAWAEVMREFPLIDAMNNPMWTPRLIPSLLRYNWVFQHYWTDGQHEWKVLMGQDYRHDFPEVPPDRLGGTGYVEMAVAWVTFARKLIATHRFAHDPIVRTSICCKTIGTCLKGGLALEHGLTACSRDEAVRMAEPHLEAGDRELARLTTRIAAGRFLSEEPDLLSRTSAFLLRYLDGVAGRSSTQPQFRAIREVAFEIDAPLDELGFGPEWRHAERLAAAARELWGESFRTACVLPALFLAIGHAVVMLEIDPDVPPSAEALAELYSRHQELGPPEGIHEVFIALRNVAVQLGNAELRGTWHWMLSPRCQADVFVLLDRPDLSVAGNGQPLPSRAPKHLTVAMEETVRSDLIRAEMAVRAAARDPSAGRFLAPYFWKVAQLLLTLGSMDGDTLEYALTVPAIQRALSRIGLPLPASLAQLQDEDHECRDSGEVGEAALAYLAGLREKLGLRPA